MGADYVMYAYGIDPLQIHIFTYTKYAIIKRLQYVEVIISRPLQYGGPHQRVKLVA
jgi:hypothetical protein